MELKVVRYECSDGVALVTLNRPDRLNAWTSRMEAEYHWCLAEADADAEVRVIVITGAGRGFCAGGDTGAFGRYASGTPYEVVPTPATADDVRPDWTGIYSTTLGLAKPVIAAVNGPAAGVGFVLMCFADIRFAAAGAKLTTSFARLGLPAEHGISWLLPRLVGAGRAADLLMSSRIMLAEEALAWGLVNRVVPPEELLEATLAYARTMAAECSPASLHAIKHQLWGDLLDDLATSTQSSIDRTATMTTTADFVEGVAALHEKRAPRFAGVVHGGPASPA